MNKNKNSISKIVLSLLLILFFSTSVFAGSASIRVFFDCGFDCDKEIYNGDTFEFLISGHGPQWPDRTDTLSVTVEVRDSNGNPITTKMSENIYEKTFSSVKTIDSIDYAGSAGTYTIHAEVYNNVDGTTTTDEITFTVKGGPVTGNERPLISSIQDQVFNVNSQYSYQVSATDADNDPLTYSLILHPDWLSIDPNTGVIYGTTPDLSSSTFYQITVRTSDGNDFDTESFTLEVTPDIEDEDGDGYPEDVDCDDNNENIWQLINGYVDSDTDGYGDPSSISEPICSGNTLPTGYSTNNNDCNDNNGNIWQYLQLYPDNDGDGNGAGSSTSVCSGDTAPTGYSTNNYDCDDNNPDIFRLTDLYRDSDNDGYGAGTPTQICSGDTAPDGYSTSSTDCNDAIPTVHPGAEEIDDNIDQNCMNDAPIITTTLGDQTYSEQDNIEITINAFDTDGDTITLTSYNTPSGSTFASNVFSWTPPLTTTTSSNNYMISFTASDGTLSDTDYLNLTILNYVPGNYILILNSFIDGIFREYADGVSYSGTTSLISQSSKISGSTIDDSTISRSNISQSSTITGSIVDNCDISNSILKNYNAKDCRIYDSIVDPNVMYYLEEIYIYNSEVYSANMYRSTITDSYVDEDSTITDSQIITNSRVIASKIETSYIEDSILENVTAQDSNIVGSLLQNTRVFNSDIYDSVIYGCDIYDSDMTSSNINSCILNNAVLDDNYLQTGTLTLPDGTVYTGPFDLSTVYSGTVAILSAPNNGVTNEDIIFDMSNSFSYDGDIVSYHIDYGDTTSQTLGSETQTVTHQYITAGTYTITLTVTDSNGATDTTTRSIIITPEPNDAPQIRDFYPESTILAGLSKTKQFSISVYDPDNNLMEANWYYDNTMLKGVQDLRNGNITTFNFNFTELGTHFIRVDLIDQYSFINQQIWTVNVVEKEIYETGIHVVEKRGKVPFTVDFTANIDGGEYPIKYYWDFGDGTTGTGREISHTYNLQGDYTVTLKVIDGYGRETTDKIEIKSRIDTYGGTPRSKLYVTSDLGFGEFDAGDKYSMTLKIQNNHLQSFRNVRVSLSIPDFGQLRTYRVSKISPGETYSKSMDMDIPEYVNPGEYLARVHIYGDDGAVRRIKYIPFIIKG